MAKKNKNKKNGTSSGGGFGGGFGSGTTTTTPSSATMNGDKTTGTLGASISAADRVSTLIAKADKTSLEKQWDIFTSITDLEIKPLGNTDEDSYQHFEVVDVFVRSGTGNTDTTGTSTSNSSTGTGWFRIGKVCA